MTLEAIAKLPAAKETSAPDEEKLSFSIPFLAIYSDPTPARENNKVAIKRQ